MKTSQNNQGHQERGFPSGPELAELIQKALEEDVGEGDATTLSLVEEQEEARAHIVSRGSYIMAGGAVCSAVFQALDQRITVKLLKKDGEEIRPGDRILYIEGAARAILTGERTALNFLQRLTGIATLTHRYVEKAARHSVTILDTRKTTPLLRALEKYAVRCGGGANHRMGLHDRVMIKDNHLVFWKRDPERTMTGAVQEARRKYPEIEIEIEIDHTDQLEEALTASPDWILLDNMTVEDVRKCVDRCGGRARLEVSGRIALEHVEDYAQSGVDAISVGKITHSAPAADLSLEMITEPD